VKAALPHNHTLINVSLVRRDLTFQESPVHATFTLVGPLTSHYIAIYCCIGLTARTTPYLNLVHKNPNAPMHPCVNVVFFCRCWSSMVHGFLQPQTNVQSCCRCALYMQSSLSTCRTPLTSMRGDDTNAGQGRTGGSGSPG
jgi:hypothetical protein